MNYQEIIASKLKEIRTSKHMSQNDVAEKSGLPKSSVCYYENGRSMDLDKLAMYCDGLGIDMFTFLDECRREMAKQKEGK